MAVLSDKRGQNLSPSNILSNIHVITVILLYTLGGLCYYIYIMPTENNFEHFLMKITQDTASLKSDMNLLHMRMEQIKSEVRKLRVQAGAGGSTDQDQWDSKYSDYEYLFNGTTIGTNYVNWGQKSCPIGSQMLYTGYAAKSLFTSHGGGVNFLCLTSSPEWSGKEVPNIQHNSYLYGVEMWANGVKGIFSSVQNHMDMSCSVCESQHRSQMLMVPGTYTCPPTWNFEYRGHLMSERTGHVSPSNYICVNKDYEFLDGGLNNEPSGYVVPVEVMCGVIPCPPYKQGHELPCVVCTK